MTDSPVNSNTPKTTAVALFEKALFVLWLCVLALRTTLTEGISSEPTAPNAVFAEVTFSLIVSAALLCVSVFWFAFRICGRKFSYRVTGLEIPLVLFCIAALVSTLAAANKRAAISLAMATVAPIAAAVLLVQILDSKTKVRLLLMTIVALGLVQVYQCQEQLFYWNEQQIELYEQDPQAVLTRQNITPDTLRHWQFEHRLYSRGVNGFFTTRNSAGCFFLLTFFAAVALVFNQYEAAKLSRAALLPLTLEIGAAVFILFGLVITKSKAAIAATIMCTLMFAVYVRFRTWLKAHKTAVALFCAATVLIVSAVFVGYGMTHDRLPGGNSMLVRWQYWVASAKMSFDNPVTGVGAGNFAAAYTRYKDPAALESVSDAHNFLLSILTQYGLCGLVGFLLLLAVPLYRTIFPPKTLSPLQMLRLESPTARPALVSTIAISAVLLLIRPIVVAIPANGTPQEISATALILYGVPVIVFVLGSLMLAIGFNTTAQPQPNGWTVAALFCGCLGAVVHSLTDFALFEPGIFMTFWALLAAIIASSQNDGRGRQLSLTATPTAKPAVAAVAAVIIWACLNYAVITPVKGIAKIKNAQAAAATGRLEQAYALLDAAARDDRLNPRPLSVNAQLHLRQYAASETKQKYHLLQAEGYLTRAANLDANQSGNFRQLTDIYNLLAETAAAPQRKPEWLRQARTAATNAVTLYPGSGQLRFELATIAEQLGDSAQALTQYEKAVEIEDAFRAQFAEMYPDIPGRSRLGRENYELAKQKITQLAP